MGKPWVHDQYGPAYYGTKVSHKLNWLPRVRRYSKAVQLNNRSDSRPENYWDRSTRLLSRTHTHTVYVRQTKKTAWSNQVGRLSTRRVLGSIFSALSTLIFSVEKCCCLSYLPLSSVLLADIEFRRRNGNCYNEKKMQNSFFFWLITYILWYCDLSNNTIKNKFSWLKNSTSCNQRVYKKERERAQASQAGRHFSLWDILR